jgi:hypothetical protein
VKEELVEDKTGGVGFCSATLRDGLTKSVSCLLSVTVSDSRIKRATKRLFLQGDFSFLFYIILPRNTKHLTTKNRIKMKKHTQILFIALAMIVVLPACKKYPDGPAVSLRSKKARLANNWSIDKVLGAGLDITAAFVTDKKNYNLEIKDDGTFTENYETGGNVNTVIGTWKFSKDKKYVDMHYPLVSFSWEILRLKQDELWLKSTIMGVIYERHLVSK